MRKLGLGLLPIIAACSLPERDNPLDPSNRPIASIEVRIGGTETAIGGRREAWELQGEITDPDDPLDRLTTIWFLSTGAQPSPADVASWLPVGEGVSTSTATSSTLAEALEAVRDFVPSQDEEDLPGEGLAQRWVRLSVEDPGGAKAEAFASISIRNRLPSVDLGPVLRIAPGGRWWEVVGGDPLSAPAFAVVIEARVADPDPGDEVFAFTPEVPAIWRVQGPLQGYLDADLDTFVDDQFLEDGEAGVDSRLVFAAPRMPVRGTITAQIGDLLDAGGAPVYAPVASLPVDVLSNHWVYDQDQSGIVRLVTARWFPSTYITAAGTAGLPVQRFLASDGEKLLLVEADDESPSLPLNAVVTDHSLRETARRDAFETTSVTNNQLYAMSGSDDGSGGWWVVDQIIGRLLHFDSTMTITANLLTVEGDVNTDFTGAHIESARDGSGDVWVCGGSSPSPTQSRLYRLSPAGALRFAAQDAFGSGDKCGSLAADGGGGVWIGATFPDQRLRRFDVNGVVQHDETLAIWSTALAFDPRNGDLWLYGGDAAGERNLAYRHHAPLTLAADGAMVLYPNELSASGAPRLLADDVNRQLLVIPDVGNAYRFDRAFAIQEVQPFVTEPPGTGQRRDVHALRGGTLVGGAATTFGATLLYLEAGGVSIGTRIPIPPVADPDGKAAAAVVDPLNGMVWVFRRADGALESYDTEGRLFTRREILAADGLPVVGASADLAFEPASRTLWLAWGQSGESGLLSYDLTGDPRDLPAETDESASLAAFTFDEVVDLDAVQDAVCLSGTDAAGSGNSTLVLRTPQGIVSRLDYEPFAAAANSLPGGANGCTFVRETFEGISDVVHLAADGTQTVFTVGSEYARGAAFDPVSQRIAYYEPSLFAAGGFTTESPLGGGAVSFPADRGYTNVNVQLHYDHFYGHLFAAFTGYSALDGGLMVRLDGTFSEVDSAELLSPALVMAP